LKWGAPEEFLVLRLAKEYGQAPEDVEKWDAYMFERAAVLMHAEGLEAERRNKELEKQSRRK